MKNLLSYCGFVAARIRASDKYLSVSIVFDDFALYHRLLKSKEKLLKDDPHLLSFKILRPIHI